MLYQKLLSVAFVPECFRASGSRDGQRSGAIARLQANINIPPADEFVKETSVEGIASADRIDNFDCRG